MVKVYWKDGEAESSVSLGDEEGPEVREKEAI